MIAVPGGGHPGILLLVFQTVFFQLPHLLHHMGHVHPFHHFADQVIAHLGLGVAGFDIGDVGGCHVVAVFAEAVTHSSGLVTKAKEILEGCAGLGITVVPDLKSHL